MSLNQAMNFFQIVALVGTGSIENEKCITLKGVVEFYLLNKLFIFHDKSKLVMFY